MEMKVEEGKIYKVLAKSKTILFLPNGDFYDYGSKLDGEFEAKTLRLIFDAIEILAITEKVEEKVSNSTTPKNAKVQEVDVSQKKAVVNSAKE